MVIKQLILNILIASIIIYVLTVFFLYFAQRSLIYFPSNQDFKECKGFADYEKINHNGTRMYFKEKSKDIIIYYHGNAGSACDRSHIKHIFEKSNKSLAFIEYAGYSNDERKPSEKLIQKDVENVQRFIKEKQFKKVIVYGQSIGSGVASYHAYTGRVDSLILVSAFTSLKDVAQSKYRIFPVSMLMRESYNNVKHLKDYENEITVLHGEKDYIIPKRFSKKLLDEIGNENKEYFVIKNKGHNDIWESNEFKDILLKKIKN